MKLRIFHIFIGVCLLVGFCYNIINLIGRRNVNTYYCSPNDSQCRTDLIKLGKTSMCKTIVTYTDTPYLIKMILEHTRSQINSKFSQFNHSGIGPLEDLVMELGGQPRRSLIISTWRSGTTFLGQALNAIPCTYYHYEPLHSFGIKQLRHIPETNEALRTIRNMMMCDYQNMTSYFKYASEHSFLIRYNTRLWSHCNAYKNGLCFNAELTSQFCRLFPFQTMKVLRVNIPLITKILDDKELNTKVILLVRDPRGVMQSRQHVSFCNETSCLEPSILCADMVNNYMAALEIITQFPDRLMVVRFEELALEPNTTMHRVLKFLSLVATKPFYEFLHEHTKKEITHKTKDVYSTVRLSSSVPFRWKDLLDFNYVNKIQMACENAMSLWGYKLAENETHMKRKDFIPITNLTMPQ